MDIYDNLNAIWIDCTWCFFLLSFLVFVVVLLWQAIKNKKEQAKILEQYKHNLEILKDLKNRF